MNIGKPARCNVPFWNIGGLYFTVFADSQLARWEQQFSLGRFGVTQTRVVAPRNEDGVADSALWQHAPARGNLAARGDKHTTIYSRDSIIAWRSSDTMLGIRRRASRWKYRMQHSRSSGPLGVVNALQRAFTRWRQHLRRPWTSVLSDAVVRASTR